MHEFSAYLGPNNGEDLLSAKEAAGYLRLSPKTLNNWRCKGVGPTVVRVGKRAPRYRVADLEAFIAESTNAVAS